MKPFRFLFPLIAIASIFTACGDDENEPPQTTIVVPDGAPSLNMMNENNGKSIVANTDVYLDQNNNFISPNDYLIYCTKKLWDVQSVTIDYGDINIKSVNGDVTITAKGPSKGVIELYERAGLLCRIITINIVP